MSMTKKRTALLDWFRKNGGFPKGCVTIDNNTETIGNVSVNGTFYGVFDYENGCFIDTNDQPKRADYDRPSAGNDRPAPMMAGQNFRKKVNTMTLEQFKSEARTLAISYLNNVNIMLEDKTIEPELKRRLIATAQSLALYVQDELENICTGSKKSISEN